MEEEGRGEGLSDINKKLIKYESVNGCVMRVLANLLITLCIVPFIKTFFINPRVIILPEGLGRLLTIKHYIKLEIFVG